MTRDELKTELEKEIDTIGLMRTMELLVEICYEKSDHVLSTWQDRELAKSWNTCAQQIDRLSTKLDDILP